MSKKKKKLDKKLIQERLRELETETRITRTEKKEPSLTQKQKESPKEEQVEIKRDETDNFLIIKDLKKVALLTGVIILIFITLYFINLKTNLILQASDKIFNILHVGQLST